MDDPAAHIVAPDGAEIPVARWRARRRRKPLGRVHWRDIEALISETVSGWSRHNVPRLGASLAFYALLSLMPLLLVVISVAGLVFGHRAAQTGVVGQIQILIGAPRAKIVEGLLEGAQSKAGGLVATVLGTLTLMFGASGALIELRDALNTIWEVAPRRLTTTQEIASAAKQRLWSIALVLAISLVLTGTLLLGTWISAAGEFCASVLPAREAVLHFLNAIISYAAVTGLFCAIYKIMPDVPIEWRDVILGAAATSLFFTLGNVLLSFYLGKASFSSTYGAAASTIVLALWVYYSSQVFFLGAEFTRAFAERYGSSPSSKPPPLKVVSDAASIPDRQPLNDR